MVDRVQTCEPLQRRVDVDLSSQFPRRPNTTAVAIEPYADEQPRIKTTSSWPAWDALDGRVKFAQIKLTHELPKGTRRMIATDQFLHIDGAHNHLSPVTIYAPPPFPTLHPTPHRHI